jgi:hypothetical protein
MKLATLAAVAAVALGASAAHAAGAGPANLTEFNSVYNQAVQDGVRLGIRPTKDCGTQRCDNAMVYVQGDFTTALHHFVYQNNASVKVLCIIKRDDQMHDLCFDDQGTIWGEEYVGGSWQLSTTYRKGWNDQLAGADQGTL